MTITSQAYDVTIAVGGASDPGGYDEWYTDFAALKTAKGAAYDLVTNTERWLITLIADLTDTFAMDMVTNATYYVHIDLGGYTLQSGTQFVPTISIQAACDCAVIENGTVLHTAELNGVAIDINGDNVVLIRLTVANAAQNIAGYSAVNINSTVVVPAVLVFACHIKDSNCGVRSSNFDYVNLLNLTITGCSTGIQRDDTGAQERLAVYNTVVYDAATAEFDLPATTTGSHNAGSTSIPFDDASPSNVTYTGDPFDDASTGDFHPGEDLATAGTDVSSILGGILQVGYSVDVTDFDGDAIDTWMIGAWLPVGGGPAPAVVHPSFLMAF